MSSGKEHQPAAQLRAARKGKPSRDNLKVGRIGGMDIGSVFARRRKELGLTQIVLAEISGISDCYISMIEQNRGNPTIFLLLALSDSLDIKFSEIMARAEQEAE